MSEDDKPSLAARLRSKFLAAAARPAAWITGKFQPEIPGDGKVTPAEEKDWQDLLKWKDEKERPKLWSVPKPPELP